MLDLEARRRIADFVRENPGLHLRALAEKLAMPVSTLEYHCYQLTRHGHLATRDTGGFKAFYPGEGLDRRDKDILYLVRHDAPRRICTHLLLNPGATPGDLKPVIGLSGPTLSFHLKKMRDAGLLREEPAGRTKRLFVEDPERVASVLVTYRRSFLDERVDAFSSMWLEMHPPERKPEAGGQAAAPGPIAPEGQERAAAGGQARAETAGSAPRAFTPAPSSGEAPPKPAGPPPARRGP